MKRRPEDAASDLAAIAAGRTGTRRSDPPRPREVEDMVEEALAALRLDRRRRRADKRAARREACEAHLEALERLFAILQARLAARARNGRAFKTGTNEVALRKLFPFSFPPVDWETGRGPARAPLPVPLVKPE